MLRAKPAGPWAGRDAAPTSASTGASGIGCDESGWGTQKYGGQTMRAAYFTSDIPLMFAGTQLNANRFSKDKSYLLTFEAEVIWLRGITLRPFRI
ncbi:MAG: hypothetical protein II818_00525 [Aeriscardovia sp.]|nr:hypothetical protein [Aeriscardovia sp.]